MKLRKISTIKGNHIFKFNQQTIQRTNLETFFNFSTQKKFFNFPERKRMLQLKKN